MVASAAQTLAVPQVLPPQSLRGEDLRARAASPDAGLACTFTDHARLRGGEQRVEPCQAGLGFGYAKWLSRRFLLPNLPRSPRDLFA